MKATTILKSILTGVLLSVSTSIVLAQNAANPACPFGNEPGYGRSLSPEQRAEHRAAVQELLAELQAKSDAGTATAEDLAWLNQFQQRGGPGFAGARRGAGAGKGPGAGNGMGRRMRRGARDGSGPRCGNLNGACPFGNSPQRRGQR
jgi:hypothetical protein